MSLMQTGEDIFPKWGAATENALIPMFSLEAPIKDPT